MLHYPTPAPQEVLAPHISQDANWSLVQVHLSRGLADKSTFINFYFIVLLLLLLLCCMLPHRFPALNVHLSQVITKVSCLSDVRLYIQRPSACRLPINWCCCCRFLSSIDASFLLCAKQLAHAAARFNINNCSRCLYLFWSFLIFTRLHSTTPLPQPKPTIRFRGRWCVFFLRFF